MAVVLQTRHILPLLKERGFQVSRSALAAMSDLLGLHTRTRVANEVPRRWGPEEVDLVVAGLLLRRRWQLTDEQLVSLLDDADGSFEDELVSSFRDLLAQFRRSAAATVRPAGADVAGLPLPTAAERSTAA